MERKVVRLDRTGRLLIPSQFRKEMDLNGGSEVIVALDKGELRVYTRDLAIRRIQEACRKLATPGVSIVDELIAERREEARRELED